LFFEKFREDLTRLPVGLIRPGPAATSAAIASAEAALKTQLPPSYVSFLRSFDGADLFHEAVLLAGVGDAALRRLVDLNPPRAGKTTVIFAEIAGGDRFAFGTEGRVLRVRPESDERWISGGDFARWLDGLVAYHRVLYGPDGEFAPDVFEADGSEVVPVIALRQTERALRLCPDSAEWHHERGVALRRLGRFTQAKEAFARAATLDPENPWPRFDEGRAALALGPAGAREAGAAFEAAARLDRGEAASRLWAWAARAAALEAAPARQALCRHEALTREPALADQLLRARDAARDEGNPDEIAEAEALLDAVQAPIQGGRVRLPVIVAHPLKNPDVAVSAGRNKRAPPVRLSVAAPEPARPAPPPGPRRPARATPPRSGGPRVGRRR
jgi:tetratricopeptide (TPR) repeat protein